MGQIIALVLTSLVSSLIARLLLGAGLSVITFSFINDLVENAKIAVGNAFMSLPNDILSLLQLLKIPLCVSVIMSAIGIAAFVKSAKIIIGKA